jgi:uncharacterized membrane protein
MSFRLIRFSTVFLSGLIAGTFFYGTFCVLPAFYEVPPDIHLTFRTTLMQYNKVLVMLLVLLEIVFNTIYFYQIRQIKIARTLCLVALIFTLISLIVTRFGSVPINLVMKTWDPSAPPPGWLGVLEKWDFYNAVRTATSIGSFVLLLIATEIQKTGNNLFGKE